jgi:hypothetical protein
MPENDSATSEGFDLKRYRQAADVAYRFAKNKVDKAQSSKKKDEDPFSKEDKMETKP